MSSSLAEIPAFNPNPIDGKGRVQVAKTGLGSSAALTTSLVGALLQFDGIVKLKLNPDAAVNDDRHDRDLEIIHNLGQVAHSLAQGKVGSGFDVSSAVYGE